MDWRRRRDGELPQPGGWTVSRWLACRRAVVVSPMLCVLIAGCASSFDRRPADPSPSSSVAGPSEDVPAFSAPPAVQGEVSLPGPEGAISEAWEPWIIHPSKTLTRYRIERTSHGLVLRADANASASGLATRLRVDPAKRPYLEWQWRVDALIEGADNTTRHAEDSPVRVVLAFDGDKSTLSFKDRMFFEQAKLLGGQDMPYATLMYIWENRAPVGTVIQNAYTSRVRKMVVSSGPRGVREWQRFRRNIVEDYRAAFGAHPGRLIGIAVFSDTDNTKGKATAWYGDIRLSGEPR